MASKFKRVHSGMSKIEVAYFQEKNANKFKSTVQDHKELSSFVQRVVAQAGSQLRTCQRDLATHGYLNPSQCDHVRQKMAQFRNKIEPTETATVKSVKPPKGLKEYARKIALENAQEPHPELVQASASSNHIGEAGQKLDAVYLQVVRSYRHGYGSKYGSHGKRAYTVIMEDGDKNQIVYRGDSVLMTGLRRADVVYISATIKGHDVYEDSKNMGYPVKQTLLHYPEVHEVFPKAATSLLEDEPTYTETTELPKPKLKVTPVQFNAVKRDQGARITVSRAS